jgi:hypothetical protein
MLANFDSGLRLRLVPFDAQRPKEEGEYVGALPHDLTFGFADAVMGVVVEP